MGRVVDGRVERWTGLAVSYLWWRRQANVVIT